jgi:murein L,D-transpeptidase YcbB/YkuD
MLSKTAIQPLTLSLLVVLLSSCASTGRLSGIEHNNQFVKRMDAPISQYASLSNKPWPNIHLSKRYKPGEQSTELVLVRQRLRLLGDLQTQSRQADLYDEALINGIKRFQARHGLKADGVLGASTIKALNITPKARLRALKYSQRNWSKLPESNEPYVQVNIPSYELYVRQGQQNALKMNVVVGKKSWPTPVLNSEIKTMVLNPKWNVPRNIVEKEIVHKMVDVPNYLFEQGLQIHASWKKDAEIIDPTTIAWEDYVGPKDLPFRISQAAGERNALGQIKFIFPNDEQVYLHDTQAKSLFAHPKRSYSHGCIRLEKPLDLMQTLANLSSESHLEKAAVHLESQQTRYLPVKPIPIYITYMTAWVDEQGVVQFRPDIYGHFQEPETAIITPSMETDNSVQRQSV